MDALVSSILDATQLQDGKLHLQLDQFELAEFVSRISEEWKETHPGHEFPVIDGHALTVRADRERLRQILDNLLSNAVKYGGSSKIIRIQIEPGPSSVTVDVADDGKGIPPHELPQIFNFHRVAGQGGRGHGLGLYSAAALARLHGGELTVESELERGSVFSLRLPRLSDDAAAA